MARLPQPGGDDGQWGDILNEYLSESLKSDGRLKDNSVTANVIAPNSITNAAIASNAVNATSIADGSVTETLLSSDVQAKLNAGAGTPSWSSIADKPAVIAAGVTESAARSMIGAGTSDLVIGTTATTAKAGNYTPTKSEVGLANADNTSDLSKPISTATQTALNDKADLVSGKIPSTQLPAIALTDVVTVADQAAMLALTATQVQPGDIAVRTDGAGTFVLTAADPATLASWIKLNAPTDIVTSVNGHVGTIVLAKSDIGLANVDNTSDLDKPISATTQDALDEKADLVSGKIPSSQLPALALTSVVTVANQAAMLALTTGQVQPGDIAVRTDGVGTFILTDTDPSVLANWALLSSPTDAVTSVSGKTGTVTLVKSDVGLGNVDNTSDTAKNSATATLTNKTIDGANNTLQNIPQSAVAGLSVALSQTIRRSVSTLTTTSTIAAVDGTDYIVFLGAGAAPTLPTAVANTGQYTLKNIHTTNITIATTLSQTIDGSTTAVIVPDQSIDVVSDGTNWRII